MQRSSQHSRSRSGAAAKALLSLAVLATGPESRAGEPPITTAGWGAVRVGTSAASPVLAASGFRPVAAPAAGSECYYLASPAAPGLDVMVDKGQVARVETEHPRYTTPSGVRVGETESGARRVYAGRLVERPHKYVEGGHYLVVYASDRKSAVVLEIVAGKVKSIRGGRVPQVEYVEGCS